MREDTTLIDRESAEKALAALDDRFISEGVIDALSRVLARKLGHDGVTPLPTGDKVTEKFERFFDMLFDVAPTNDPMPVERVIELAERARDGLFETIEDVLNDPDEEDWDSMIAMYQEDAADFEKIISLLKAGDCAAAINHWEHMDTAARGRLYADGPIDSHHFAIFLLENS